ncbi:MAG: uracil-DNA glycosylase [Sulfurimonas sp. RIFCSPHIGHO2_12_FULL_36_9]|uniref:uracil-DNA glycosylase n=1 Tax=Sulfurimonas sp. RIFCSPLOWO2_12_36_12 TaxID=1802253 RepID=UPI0008B54EDB|nr:uracil-DNA glycosylase [Sulfurimonas sp. RIFCSPLOWO2_12_36_12]OHD98647.1 MAG: uracil-DNA glycosylase [Sulfurimonas sp. RIFCSPHIGHO2_12_FULL_36_9]OHE00418.1 MAG: uracil-DNA glycosylase [Sulfurimonas sp. RIFCSPLOWO2_12_36_12]OHE05277.1 MAG: uracil-DNA glycosylase [Sulfurimonas sp. RIFCSPLOWO2_12_FULL_36_74]
MINPKIDESWREVLFDEFQKPYFGSLKEFLTSEKQKHTVYPHGSNIFAAFDNTPFDNVKVVILGQDPYHGVNQAHGLAFSVNEGVPFPPSLQNIFKELRDDMGCDIPKSGNLTSWTKEGVFLLNTVLSVRASEANSHKNRGWEIFTDSVIRRLSEQKENLVFILWGNPAGTKASLIDEKKHLILKSPHPSPLSSYRGFFGSKPFSKTNEFLKSKAINPIKWCI